MVTMSNTRPVALDCAKVHARGAVCRHDHELEGVGGHGFDPSSRINAATAFAGTWLSRNSSPSSTSEINCLLKERSLSTALAAMRDLRLWLILSGYW
jgi:hypothetical protein